MNHDIHTSRSIRFRDNLTNFIMLFCINKFFRRSTQQKQENGLNMVNQISPQAKVPPRLQPGTTSSAAAATTTKAARSQLSQTATAVIYPNTRFTDHESIPSLLNAFATFTSAFPNDTHSALPDRIRETEYRHLTTHISLDYSGFGLFSNSQTQSTATSSSSLPPFFDICYKPARLKSQLENGNQESAIESAIKKRIMDFLSISEEEYTMVCTANTTAAFKLLAESYPFHSNKRLLTIYDHDSEAVSTMEESAAKRGAKVRFASFSWPSLRINDAKLKKMVNQSSKKQSGLFVFPLESQVSGARYPYLWMRIAQENGWHVVLDASTMGPKGMDTIGLSLFRPEFIVCSFFKVFGSNPSGFASLFIKRGSMAVLESSSIAKSIGIVSIVPARGFSSLRDDFTSTDSLPAPQKLNLEEDGPYMTTTFGKESNVDQDIEENTTLFERRAERMFKQEVGHAITPSYDESEITEPSLECRSLDHADSMGLLLIRSRLRCITNWLVIALMKLQHPGGDTGRSLVKIYGPRVRQDHAPALAFNLFDWKGEKVEPALVQKLADRSNISVRCGFLQNLWFAVKYRKQKDIVMERKECELGIGCRRGERKDMTMGISVVSVSLGFLTNFEDAYGLWAFVARFLDADFVEKEKWKHVALNQKLVEM